MSWVWDEGTPRVERRMGFAGWLLEDWFATFPEAMRLRCPPARQRATVSGTATATAQSWQQ